MDVEISIFITMVQYDKELWKNLPQTKRAKWDASIRESGRESIQKLLAELPPKWETISYYYTNKFRSCNHAI